MEHVPATSASMLLAVLGAKTPFGVTSSLSGSLQGEISLRRSPSRACFLQFVTSRFPATFAELYRQAGRKNLVSGGDQSRVYKRSLGILNAAVAGMGEDLLRQHCGKKGDEGKEHLGETASNTEGAAGPSETADALLQVALEESSSLLTGSDKVSVLVPATSTSSGDLSLQAQTAGYGLAAAFTALSHSVAHSSGIMVELARRFVAGEPDVHDDCTNDEEGGAEGGDSNKSPSAKLSLSQRFQCWQERVSYLLEVGVAMMQNLEGKLQRAVALSVSRAPLSLTAEQSQSGAPDDGLAAFRRLIAMKTGKVAGAGASSATTSIIVSSSAVGKPQQQKAATKVAALAFFHGIGLLHATDCSPTGRAASSSTTSAAGTSLFQQLETSITLLAPTLNPMWPRLVVLFEDLRMSALSLAARLQK
jgi:hypothetical protein